MTKKHSIPMSREEAKQLVELFCEDYNAALGGAQHHYLVEALCGKHPSMADARVSGRSFVVAAYAIICATMCGEKVCVITPTVINVQFCFEQLVGLLLRCKDEHTRQLIKIDGRTKAIYVTGGYNSGGAIAIVSVGNHALLGARFDRAIVDADGDLRTYLQAEELAARIT